MDHLFRALPALLKEFEDNDTVREAVVFATWKRVAGELLCEHTAPCELHEKRLAIAVTNNMWKRHLEDLSGQMLFQLNTAIGSSEVTFIEFRIDENFVREHCLAARPKNGTADDFDPKADPYVTVELLLRAESITDESLRRTFLSAAASCLSRKARMKQ
jgi:Dna[CI] antecedent, DciA